MLSVRSFDKFHKIGNFRRVLEQNDKNMRNNHKGNKQLGAADKTKTGAMWRRKRIEDEKEEE